MKTIFTLLAAAALISSVQATEINTKQVLSANLSKSDITAILDIETKLNINVEPIVISMPALPTNITVLANQSKRRNNRLIETIASADVGDE
ncbi:hypothetical protein KJ365_01065 [Glaciecola sp. XM2]|jgi:hypothetical protein|uniref:hypothetical protein n=1 Tax=Glaciecola sp. XM2 TaxID=1914931 RepID=UPI001BDDFE36|nr:hypothetical protein [Glaciecola sp. XM2]MBT1449456.1 hypothetical protein [Glaciecola sp. XM2]